MTTHHPVLMVGEEGVILYTPQHDGISRKASVLWGAPDFQQQIAKAFGGRRDAGAVILLFNDSDHSYRREDNLSPAQSIERLDTCFSQMNVRGALPLGQAEAATPGNRDYLLIGLGNNGRHTMLGGVLGASGVAVAGCSVLPVESTGLVATLAAKIGGRGRWAVLAGMHETGGMRHVVIRDGVLALTRLVPMEARNPEDWAANSIMELKTTVNYLRRFGYKDEHGMEMMMVCAEADRKLFAHNAIEGANLHSMTLDEGLKLLGAQVTGQEQGRYADALYAAWTERADKLALYLPMPAIAGLDGTRH
jgi:hypothetical protein